MHNDAHLFADVSQQTARSAIHAARVVHSNMFPRHIRGEYVVFETDIQARAGDDIYAVMADGRTFTWSLDDISDEELIVHGYNPQVKVTIARRLIREFHPITMWGLKSLDRFFA